MRLIAINQFNHMISLSLNSRKNRPIPNRRIRTKEDKIIREASGRNTEVGLCFFAPFVLEVGSGGADEREAGFEGCVEAGGTDEDVDRVFGAVVAETAFFCHNVYPRTYLGVPCPRA